MKNSFFWLFLLLGMPACKQSVEQMNCLIQVQSTPARLRSFQTVNQLESYLNCEANNRNFQNDQGSSNPSVISATITNNQEEGVDEGGIVKNIGDYLITLRQGRLYAAYVGEVGRPSLSDSVSVPEAPSLKEDVWYDEVLVSEDRIIVLGFRYLVSSDEPIRGAAEIHSFRLREGKFERLKSVYIESNDYYHFSNYASRLVGGKLVFYMPHFGLPYDGTSYAPSIPHYLNFQNGKFSRTQPVLEAQNIYVGINAQEYSVFNTWLICDLPQSGDLNCEGKSILEGGTRETYLSTTHAFFWGQNTLYSLDLGTRTLKCHKVEGEPLDQYSFKQVGAVLYVVSQTYGFEKNSIQLSTLPLANFDLFGNQDLSQVTKKIEVDPGEFYFLNRFVEGAFVLGGSNYQKSHLLTIPLSGMNHQEMNLEGLVVRMEPLPGLGILALTEGYDSRGFNQLTLHSIRIDSQSRQVSSLSLPARSAEWRSHGFFFKTSGAGGVLGLPILNSQSSSFWWNNQSANIGYFSLSPTGEIAHLGTVVSNPIMKSSCETSCVDWYGNTRPIFLGERVFALMGNEIEQLNIGSGLFENLGIRLILE